MENFKPLLAKVATGLPLSLIEAEFAFNQILAGEVTAAQIAGFLMALRVRGENIDEISGAVKAMRGKMLSLPRVPKAIDIVGTGGDGSGSYNVSTLAGLIVAACGVPVAKHGNRAASSKSGAADVLQALGVKIGLSPDESYHLLKKTGFAFLFAPSHHPAMRHVAPVRSELGTRTIFNLLGPLCNPACVSRLLLGVFSHSWLEPIAETLRGLDIERAWVVHGADGLDEISTTGITYVIEVKENNLRAFEINPQEAGLPIVDIEALKGGDPDKNAQSLRNVIEGEKNAYRDIAVLNAAAALIIAEKCMNLREGAEIAQNALDSGAVKSKLSEVVESSQAIAASS